MKFTHRIFSLPVLAALVFLALAGITVRGNIESQRLSEQLEEHFFADLELSLRLAISGLRVRQEFLNAVSADPEFGIAEAEGYAEGFRFLVDTGRENPRLDAAELDSLEARFEGYVARAVPAVRMLATTDFQDLTDEQLDAVVDMNAEYDAFYEMLVARTARSQADMDAAVTNSRDRQRKRQRAATWGSIIGLGVLLLVSGAVIASVLRPLQTIMRGTEAIAAGDLYQRIEYESKDLLGRLADSFRKMQRSLIRDTNERRRAEAALRSSEERLALAFEAANDGLWDYSIPEEEMYLSPRYYEILGYREADARIVPDIPDLCRPRERASVEATWQAHFVEGKPLDLELELRRRDGEWRRVHVRGRIAELDADGRPLRSIGTLAEVAAEGLDDHGGAEWLDELGAPLASLLSSAELVIAAAGTGENGRSRATALLDASRMRVADTFSATRDLAEMRARPDVPVLGGEVVRLAAALAGRKVEVEVVGDVPAEAVVDPVDAVLRLRDVLLSQSTTPIRLSVLHNRGADDDHRFESDVDEVRIAFSTQT